VKEDSIVIGCGGHSRAILNLLIQETKSNVIKLYDLNEPDYSEVILGVPVIGVAADLLETPVDQNIKVYIAIGDNYLRHEWFEQLNKEGYTIGTLVSAQAMISLEVNIGLGTLICPLTFIGPESNIGHNTIINTSAIIEHEVRVGHSCHISPGGKISGRTKIGDRVFVGVGATVIDGINICDDVIVGAGAVVVNSINTPGTYVGVPAKLLKKFT